MSIDKQSIETLVGTKISNIDLYQKAFTHKSALKENEGLAGSFETLEFIGDSVLGFVITKFLYDFEFTNKEEDYVTSPDITDWSDEKNMGLTSTKIGIELRKYAKLQGFGNVTNKAKRVGKKTVQVWYGVKQIVEVNDE